MLINSYINYIKVSIHELKLRKFSMFSVSLGPFQLHLKLNVERSNIKLGLLEPQPPPWWDVPTAWIQGK